MERTKKFYTGLFGWKIEKMPGTGQREYWTFTTTTTNDKGGSNNGDGEQRTVSGGMLERQMPQEPIMIYIGVNSVTEYSKNTPTRLKVLEAK